MNSMSETFPSLTHMFPEILSLQEMSREFKKKKKKSYIFQLKVNAFSEVAAVC